jgi:hypothetical protein
MTGIIDLSYGTGRNLFVVKVEPAFEVGMLRGYKGARSSVIVCPQDSKYLTNNDIGKEVEYKIIYEKLGRDDIAYAKILSGL